MKKEEESKANPLADSTCTQPGGPLSYEERGTVPPESILIKGGRDSDISGNFGIILHEEDGSSNHMMMQSQRYVNEQLDPHA